MAPVPQCPSRDHFGQYTAAEVQALVDPLVRLSERLERRYGPQLREMHEANAQADRVVAAAEGDLWLAGEYRRPTAGPLAALERARGNARTTAARLHDAQRSLRPTIDAAIRRVTADPDALYDQVDREFGIDARAAREKRECPALARAEWFASGDARTAAALARLKLRELRGEYDTPGRIVIPGR